MTLSTRGKSVDEGLLICRENPQETCEKCREGVTHLETINMLKKCIEECVKI